MMCILSLTLGLMSAQPIPDRADGIIRRIEDGRFVAALPQGYRPGHHDPTTENGGQEHASFLLELPSGELLCSWFSGRMEAEYEMNVVLSRLLPNSSQWEKPVVRVGHGQANSSILSLVSTDGRGLTWTDPEPVLTKHGSFVRGRVISDETSEGRLLLPMYFTPNGYSPQTRSDYCAVQVVSQACITQSWSEVSDTAADRKRNGGAVQWTEIDIRNSSGLAQPSMVRLKNGTLRVFFRDRFCGSIFSATSTDNGRTWTPPKPTKLPNNNSGMMAFVLRSGAIIIAFNNAHIGRTPLAVALSYDGGVTWPFMRDLESQPLPLNNNCTCGRGWSPPSVPPGGYDHYHKNCNPTFAYPTVIQTQDGHIHVSYDHNRQVVWYHRFTEEWVRGGATVGVAQPDA